MQLQPVQRPFCCACRCGRCTKASRLSAAPAPCVSPALRERLAGLLGCFLRLLLTHRKKAIWSTSIEPYGAQVVQCLQPLLWLEMTRWAVLRLARVELAVQRDQGASEQQQLVCIVAKVAWQSLAHLRTASFDSMGSSTLPSVQAKDLAKMMQQSGNKPGHVDL